MAKLSEYLIAQRREGSDPPPLRTLRINWRSEGRREARELKNVMTCAKGDHAMDRMESSDFVPGGPKYSLKSI
jgi:hypothetical protein